MLPLPSIFKNLFDTFLISIWYARKCIYFVYSNPYFQYKNRISWSKNRSTFNTYFKILSRITLQFQYFVISKRHLIAFITISYYQGCNNNELMELRTTGFNRISTTENSLQLVVSRTQICSISHTASLKGQFLGRCFSWCLLMTSQTLLACSSALC